MENSYDARPSGDGLLALREQIKALGFHARPAAPIILAFAGHVLLGLGGVAVCAITSSLTWKIAALVVSSFGFVGIGTIGHTASHNAAFRAQRWNRVLYFICYPFLLQLSASYWRHSHIHTHHPQPNVVGLDGDCDLRPVFGVNRQHLDEIGGLRRRWPILQGLLILVVIPLNGLSILYQSWRRLLCEIFDDERRGVEHWIDLVCLTAHLLAWLVLPMLWFHPVDVVLVYAARLAMIGTGLFAVLAPGHFPSEALCLAQDLRHVGDFYLRQGAATVNFRVGLIGRFLCSGLQYQIEHHFFPSVSHVHLRKMQPLVKAFCADRGIPYRVLGWGEAIWKSWRVFANPKPVLADVASLRRFTRHAEHR